MTPIRTILASAAFVSLVSCASQDTTAENYDTPMNPYGPADGGMADTSGYESYDAVNPAYDAPAVYEDTTAVTPPFDPGPAVTPNVPAVPTRPVAPAGGGATQVHTVISGDTLWGLSRQYGVSIESIKQANNLTRDTVMLGQRLQIPSR